MKISPREWKRKALHAGMGLAALSLRWLDWKGAAVVAVAALLFNLLLMPRVGRSIYRDPARPRDPGILAYPAAVLAAILLFRHDLSCAAAVWGMLAFGDPAAAVAGTILGGPRLPWNRRKTWSGFFAGAAAAFLTAWGLAAFVSGPGGRLPVGMGALGALALLWAFLESVESGLDDNLVPPLPLSFALALLVSSAAVPGLAPGVDWRAAVGVNIAIGVATALLRVVAPSGAVAGAAAGSVILLLGGWGAYGILWLFFLAGTVASRAGYRIKLARGTAQARGGRRSARHVVANCSVGALVAALAPVSSGSRGAFAFAGCFAAALADTLGTEIGSLFGRKAFSPLTGTSLPAGTPGAVSWPGLSAGLAGAALIGLAAAGAGLVPLALVWVVAVAGFAGSLAESVANDLGRRWGFRLDHEFANAWSTFVGAVVALEILLSLQAGRIYWPLEP